MKFVLPLTERADAHELSDAELLAWYQYPEPVTKPYVRVNLVRTASGGIAAEGRSAGVASPPDKRLLGRLRRLADVVLMGAGTVRADNIRGARGREDVRAFRRERGLAEVPPVAVVTRSADLQPESRLFTDTYVAPIILTTASAPASRVARLADAGAAVALVGDFDIEISSVLGVLHERGLDRVLCEGGPTLFGAMVAADAVDELCLNVTARLGGEDQRAAEQVATGVAMTLVSVIESEGTVLLRYRRRPRHISASPR